MAEVAYIGNLLTYCKKVTQVEEISFFSLKYVQCLILFLKEYWPSTHLLRHSAII